LVFKLQAKIWSILTRCPLRVKKSPLEIAKEDWKEEIIEGKINIEFIEKYFWAYDISRVYTINRISDYSHILNSYMLLKENKFDLDKKSFKLIYNNYLDEFYNFINNTWVNVK